MATPYDDVILDHIKNARNYREPERVDREVKGANALCGDELALYLCLDGSRIADIGFQCTCCGLSMASASVMTELVKGKDRHETKQLLQEFSDRLSGTGRAGHAPINRGQLALLEAAQSFPARNRCLALPWATLLAALAE